MTTTELPTSTTAARASIGQLLRDWRRRRRLSQLDLALEADTSARHVSFVETGRSRPSSAMILRLADRLDVPLRERNRLLLAGGFAPAFPESEWEAPDLRAVTAAFRQVLAAHQPNPALVVDERWDIVDANAATALFLAGAAAHLVEPPVNALRLSLHPGGLASRIRNLGEWRAHVLSRLRRQADRSRSPELEELARELAEYPCDDPEPEGHPPAAGSVVVPLRIGYDDRELAFFSLTTVVGTPLDVTVEELAIEAFYPADEATATFLRERGQPAVSG